MKRSLRKSLAILLSLLTLMSCMAIGVPAVCAEDCTHNFEFSYDVAPTCVEGYSVYTCTLCGATEKRDFVAAVAEHQYMFMEKVAPTCTKRGYDMLRCSVCADIKADPDSYVDMIDHTYTEYSYTLYDSDNQYYRQSKTCDVCAQTFTDDEYYKVNLVKSVKVGDVYEHANVVDNAFAKKNGTVLYDGTPTLSVSEDDTYAEWDFQGWIISDGTETAADARSLTDITITEPITLAAVFNGKDVYYDVVFYDFAGRQLGETQHILYKHAATAPTNVTQQFIDNHVQYTFEGWNKTFDCVTSKLFINPVYSQVSEQVTVLFYNYKDEIIKSWTGDYNTPLYSIAPTAEELARPADDTYVYEYTGRWENAKGEIQNSANKNLSLYPIYVLQPIKYDVSLRVFYNGVGSENASYQVLAPNGNLVAAGYTNSAGRSEGLQLSNGTYTVKCSSADYLKAGETVFTVDSTGIATLVDVELVENDEYYDDGTKNCACICHSVVSGIWIKILNFMYSLFNIRYVCCNDMYAVHGAELKYTA